MSGSARLILDLARRIRAVERSSVSVVIPTRGRPKLLPRAVTSVLAQDYGGQIECLVVFDGDAISDPGVPAREGRSVRTLTNDRAPGPAGARNAGVSEANGDLVAFLDDDDEWSADKLSRQVALLDRCPSAIAASCGVRVVSAGRTFVRVPSFDLLFHGDLVGSRHTEAHTSTLLARRSEFDRVGPFDETLPAGYGEDYDWFLRATELGPIVIERRALVTLSTGASWFASRWDTIVAGVQAQLRRHPELATNRHNLARMYGRLAFAHAAAGRPKEAWRWGGRSLRRDPFQPRGYAAIAVALRLVSALRVVDALAARGKGI